MLVVDDYADVRALVGILLRAEGHSVVEVAHGGEAVRLVREQDFDLVVIDVLMPVMDGWEAARRIGELSSVPVMFLTACVDDTARQRCMHLGAAGFVEKPFERCDLVRAVGEILAGTDCVRRDDDARAG